MKVRPLYGHLHSPSYSPGSYDYQRSTDTTGDPSSKKAHWSPNSFANNGGNGGNGRDALANYGYGPQSSLSQGQFNGTPSNGFGGASYSTPFITINTNTSGDTGLPSQLNPNPGVAA